LIRQLRDSTNAVRLSLHEDFTDTDFNEILGKYTTFNPMETGAVLDATSFEDLTVCRANNYNAVEFESPLLNCSKYDEFQCDLNDYIVMDDDEKCSIGEVST
jgi:hypothetical protein